MTRTSLLFVGVGAAFATAGALLSIPWLLCFGLGMAIGAVLGALIRRCVPNPQTSTIDNARPKDPT